MTTLQGTVEVCTFCYNAHLHYNKNHAFNIAQKQAVQICWCCMKGMMCRDCVTRSHEEIEGTILAQYGFEICCDCITTIRRTEALKPKLIHAVKQAVEDVKAKMATSIYTLTHKATCV